MKLGTREHKGLLLAKEAEAAMAVGNDGMSIKLLTERITIAEETCDENGRAENSVWLGIILAKHG